MISKEALDANFQKLAMPYPGRVVMVGLDEKGTHLRQFNLIAGRPGGSSGNRVFEFIDDGRAISTAVFDKTLPSGDPDKTIYITQTSVEGVHCSSNGRQTKDIAEKLDRLFTFSDGQKEWENEGEGADFTARITGVNFTGRNKALLGRISRNPLDFPRSVYETFELDLVPGYAFFISTYDGMGGVEPSTSVPLPIAIPGSLYDNMEMLWDNFSTKTRVALVGRNIEKGSGRLEYAPFKQARLGD